jgi:hypothetical protein
VDVKSGGNAYIVLYPERPRMLPVLEGVAELPERVAAALPRGVGSDRGAPPVEAWEALAKLTSGVGRSRNRQPRPVGGLRVKR